jgi:hypothetical protein
MRTAGSFLGIALAAALGVACASSTQGPTGPEHAYNPVAGRCPLAQLQGVHAGVSDTKDGVAITFTAPEVEVKQLRDNVHAMADANDKKNDPFAACPCGSQRAMGAAETMPGESGSRTTLVKPLAEATVDETPTGAVLKLSATDKSQVDVLRTAARENIRAIRRNCLGQTAPQPAQPSQPSQPPPEPAQPSP